MKNHKDRIQDRLYPNSKSQGLLYDNKLEISIYLLIYISTFLCF